MAYLLLCLAYVLSGKLGLMLALPPGYASPIFPPAGIAVAAALIGGRRTLPWIFIGSLLLNIWVGYSSSQQINAQGFAIALIIALASMLQAAVGGWGLRRLIGYPTSLDHSSEVLRFLLLAPAICLTSATISVSSLSALGVFELANFATNWAAWWVGDTLGVLVMLPLIMIAAGEPRTLWKSRRLTVAVPMLLLFTLFVMIFLKANQWEYSSSMSDFRLLSQQSVNQVQTRLEEQTSLLEQMSGIFLHDAKGSVTRAEFHRFVQKSLLRFPMIQALEWVPWVDAEHRASFEAEQGKDIPGFEIRERNAMGQLVRANERAAFYPVTYIEPLAGNQAAMGFDLASNPKRREALNKAIQSGTAVTTPALHLVQDFQPQAGVLLLLAVNPHDRKSGVVLSVLRMGDFMDKLLQDTHPMLYTRLVDLDEQTPIYDNFAPESPQALYERTFDFGSRHYRLETAPTPVYLMQHHGWQSWSVLAAGILGTGLLGALFLLGTGYTTRIEAQVDERTRELKESRKHLQEAQHMAQIGSWELDIAKNILHWSDEIYNIFEIDPASFGASYEFFLNTVHPEDRSLVENTYTESVNNRTPYNIEHRLLFPDGRIKFVHERCQTFYDLDGQAVLSTGTVQDITERKMQEHQLGLFRNLFELTSDCVFLISPKADFRFVFVNDATCRHFGLERSELLKLRIPDWDPNFKDQASLEALWKKIKEKRGLLVETIHRVASGREVPVEVSGNYLLYQGEEYIAGYFQDITERKASEEKIRTLAFYDSLTQLPNRRLLGDRLTQAMAVSKRSGYYGAVMFLDLDNFKPLNDSYGHDVGDLLLIEVARRISDSVRDTDTVARFGGDEFVVMLNELDTNKAESTAQANIVAEKIRATLEAPYFLTVHNRDNPAKAIEHRCSSSIGIALFIGHEASPEEIIKWADVAMYRAKECGRNSIRFYDK